MLNCIPLQKYAEVLVPSTCASDCIEKHCDCISFESQREREKKKVRVGGMDPDAEHNKFSLILPEADFRELCLLSLTSL